MKEGSSHITHVIPLYHPNGTPRYAVPSEPGTIAVKTGGCSPLIKLIISVLLVAVAATFAVVGVSIGRAVGMELFKGGYGSDSVPITTTEYPVTTVSSVTGGQANVRSTAVRNGETTSQYSDTWSVSVTSRGLPVSVETTANDARQAVNPTNSTPTPMETVVYTDDEQTTSVVMVEYTTDEQLQPTTVSQLQPTTVSQLQPTTVSQLQPTTVSQLQPTTVSQTGDIMTSGKSTDYSTDGEETLYFITDDVTNGVRAMTSKDVYTTQATQSTETNTEITTNDDPIVKWQTTQSEGEKTTKDGMPGNSVSAEDLTTVERGQTTVDIQEPFTSRPSHAPHLDDTTFDKDTTLSLKDDHTVLNTEPTDEATNTDNVDALSYNTNLPEQLTSDYRASPNDETTQSGDDETIQHETSEVDITTGRYEDSSTSSSYESQESTQPSTTP